MSLWQCAILDISFAKPKLESNEKLLKISLMRDVDVSNDIVVWLSNFVSMDLGDEVQRRLAALMPEL